MKFKNCRKINQIHDLHAKHFVWSTCKTIKIKYKIHIKKRAPNKECDPITGIDFTYIEQNPYHKTPEWLAVNPRGLVPALIHKGRSIIESPIIMEYLDEEWGFTAYHLLPRDTYLRSLTRLMCDVIERSIIAPYSIILKSPVVVDREKAKVKLLEGLLRLFSLADSKGPFLMGDEAGFADVMLVPHVQRIMVVLTEYRNMIVPSCMKFARFREWWSAVQNLESYKTTAQSRETLLMHYKKFVEVT